MLGQVVEHKALALELWSQSGDVIDDRTLALLRSCWEFNDESLRTLSHTSRTVFSISSFPIFHIVLRPCLIAFDVASGFSWPLCSMWRWADCSLTASLIGQHWSIGILIS
jgi:hypothetical protein